MHQPYYKDDLSNSFLLPWVRLRCAKDYHRVAAILDRYPNVKQTFNLVPSLTAQIEDYVSGTTTDVYRDLAERAVEDLSEEERAFVVRWMTESSQIRRVRQYPRYLELVLKREQATAHSQGEFARLFSDQEVRDLQVWFNLSWIEPEMLAADATLSELVRKGRAFEEKDKAPIFQAQADLMARVLPTYAALKARGQIELTTSPAYHPILPLITDLESARAATPEVALPARRFTHPDDAVLQVRLAVQAHARIFGSPPKGLWPPELAVGEEIAGLASSNGLRWAVADEGVLARSLGGGLDRDWDGRPRDPARLYTPYHVESPDGALDLVVRDAQLSNLIGFEYQKQPADQAAANLVSRLHAIAALQDGAAAPMLVTIALDGENCWDFYEENGNRFLHSLYARLNDDQTVRLTTVSAFLDEHIERRPLSHIVPGSWINADLRTWIGDPEHNRAWTLLAEAREFVAVKEDETREADAVQRALREMLIAEGSDWFWWFNRSHDSGMDQVWDNLFRLHLRNAYTLLDRRVPVDLFRPVAQEPEAPASKRPDRKISPKLDGVVDESEWRAGGYVDAAALFGAMHPPTGLIRRIWFGHDDRQLYLRVDLLRGLPLNHPVELRVFFSGSGGAAPSEDWRALPATLDSHHLGFEPAAMLTVALDAAQPVVDLRPVRAGTVAPGAVWQQRLTAADPLAFAVPFSALGHEPGETLEMVTVVVDGRRTVEQLPPTGSIKVRVPGDVFAGRQRPLKILLVSAEVAPFAKVGGLADVAGALPKALKRLGHDVRVVMPRYGSIDVEKYGLKPVLRDLQVPLAQQTIPSTVLEGRIGEEVPIYFIDNAQFFAREGMYGLWDDDARFIYFSRAALEMLRPLGFKPDVVHVNDWHTAVIPNMLARLYDGDPFYAEMATVLTIHNLAFQGVFGYGTLHLANLDPWGLIKPGIPELDEIVNLLGRGAYFSDVVNTVSDRYAQEILTPEYGEKMDPLLRGFKDKLFGIINGIDYDVFNPQTDASITARYSLESLDGKMDDKLALQKEVGLSPSPRIPVVGLISRLYDQKGLDLIANIMWGLTRLNLQLVVLGAGDSRYEQMFRTAAKDHPDKVAATIGFNAALAQHIYAGSDMFLMPSRFEPCGLGQLISLRYGTIPIVRATGGLADTIQDWDPVAQTGNGFVFEAYDHWDLYAQVVRAVETYRQPALWRTLQRNAMTTDVSWTNSAQQYVRLYQAAIRNHAESREYTAPAAAALPW
jgi:starch synthase